MKPLLFLDVDGVLNAIGPGPYGYDDMKSYTAQGFTLHMSKRMAQDLIDLGADIWWATTWILDDAANRYISPILGLPTDLPCIPRKMSDWGNWKAHGVASVVQELERPFIWVDDDAIYSAYPGDSDLATGKAIVESATDVDKCLIQPDPYMGLLPEMVEQMAEWVGVTV